MNVGILQGLKPLPSWDEFAPVPILSLKEALLEGRLDFQIPFRQLNLTVPLRVLTHDRLPGLIQKLFQRLREITPGCRDILTESAQTREVLFTMGNAVCMLIVLGDTCTEAAISAQGFHAQEPGRPSPPGLIQQAVVCPAPASLHSLKYLSPCVSLIAHVDALRPSSIPPHHLSCHVIHILAVECVQT